MQDFINFLLKHPALSASILFLIIALIIIEFLRAKRHRFSLNPAQVTTLINRENAIIIDIRPKEMFVKGHVIGAQSFTTNDIKENNKKLEKFKNKPIIIICATGVESQKLAVHLKSRHKQVYILGGGMPAWANASMPIVKE
jgi:rhodanese-related sulfurtransferase